MKVVTSKEMQNIDKITIEKIGIPGEVLMGYAGKSIADFITNKIADITRVAIFSGTGNNGGDGFVVGYFLANKGFEVDIYIAGSSLNVSKTSSVYLKVCKNYEINILELKEKTSIDRLDLNRYNLIVDALLGTGFTGRVRGVIRDIIEKINRCSAKVLSIDIPSGLPSDGDSPDDVVIDADYTITIGLPKISLMSYPGMEFAGELIISDIGFPYSLTNSDELTIEIIDSKYVKERLNVDRDVDTHKGKVGHLLLVGGFDNMEGAIIMAVQAAFEVGIGLATLLTTERARSIIAGVIPELITRSFHNDLFDSFNNCFTDTYNEYSQKVEEMIVNFFMEGRGYEVLLIGPGMGRSIFSSTVFNVIMDNLSTNGIKKVLIDGDGLFHFSHYLREKEKPQGASLVITPHFFEASRLMNKSVEELKRNRVNSVKELSRTTSAVALLKGPATAVSDGNMTLINTSGNPYLATAGSGDILSGIIGALLLNGLSSLDAAGIGAYIHGKSGDNYLEENIDVVLKATDIIKNIRSTISKCIRNI